MVHLSATKPVWRIVSWLGGVLVSGCILWLTFIQSTQAAQAGDTKQLAERVNGADRRLERLESEIAAVRSSTQEIKGDLREFRKGVDDKLDRLLERGAQK